MPATAKATILLTGATGFIGGRVLQALLEDGFSVRALVRDPGRLPRRERLESRAGDLCDPSSLKGIEQGIDGAVHCASILGKWGTPGAQIEAVNVQGTINLLDRLERQPGMRLLHLSAGGVTGPVKARAVDESYDCRPATAYERTKLTAEREVLRRHAAGRIECLVVRPTFTYGPGDPHKLALFRAVKRGRYAFISGGHSVNHPVYIDDLIRGVRLAYDHGRPGEIYIVGGNRPVTKRELVNAIADRLGVRRPWISIPRWVAEIAAFKLELLARVHAFEPILTRSRVMMMADNFGYSIDKARRELGYEPQVELEEGIARTVEAYREAGAL